jgi:hypothetical protein
LDEKGEAKDPFAEHVSFEKRMRRGAEAPAREKRSHDSLLVDEGRCFNGIILMWSGDFLKRFDVSD